MTDEGLIHRRAGKLLFRFCALNDDELPFLPVIGRRREPTGFQYFLDFVVSNRQPGDAVVTASLASTVYTDYFHTDWTPVYSLQDLDSIRNNANRTWLVYSFQPVLQAVNPDILDIIQQDFKLVTQFEGTVREGTVYVYLVEGLPRQ